LSLSGEIGVISVAPNRRDGTDGTARALSAAHAIHVTHAAPGTPPSPCHDPADPDFAGCSKAWRNAPPKLAIKISGDRLFGTPPVHAFDFAIVGMTYRAAGIYETEEFDASDWFRTSLTSPVRPDPNAPGETALHSKYPARRDRRRPWPIYARTRKRNKPPWGRTSGEETKTKPIRQVYRAARNAIWRVCCRGRIDSTREIAPESHDGCFTEAMRGT